MSDLIEKCTEVNDKVNQLIKDHKIQEAYDLLKNELSSSYVPEPFLKDWEHLLIELSLKIDENKNKKERKEYIKKLKRSDLLKNILRNDKTIDFDFLNLYLYKFKNFDDKQDTEIFQLILNRKDIKQDEKMYLWSFLFQHSDHIYEFYNAIIDKKEILTPNFLMDHYDKACELNSIINKKTSKDVAKNKLAEDCAKIISYYYFPSSMQKELNISSNEVAEIIINEIDNDYFSNPDGANPILSKIMQYFQ